MLEELNVKNFALIDDITVSFSAGFNVLSGETGAGKSILVGALGVLLGKKADTSFIRNGCQEAVISGILNVSGHREIPNWMAKHGITDEEGTLIIRRTLKRTGRGSIYVQSVPVLRADLEELTSYLVDMHSQHEHQSLFVIENHRKLLDRFAGLEKEAVAFNELFQSLSRMKKNMKQLQESKEDHVLLIEKLKKEIAEIESAELVSGEEEVLEKDIALLSRREEVFSSIEAFRSLISENRGGVLSRLREAGSTLDSLSEIDDGLSPLQKRLESSFYELEDIVDTLRTYQQQFEINPEELPRKEERLALISSLEKKYGNTLDEVLQTCEGHKQKLLELEDSEFDIDKLKNKIEAETERLKVAALALSEKRTDAAVKLQSRIESNLKELGMSSARFIVDLDRQKNKSGTPVYAPWGIDSIEFLLSANSGEPEKPLRSVASGGEISRVMLALKTVLADSDDVSSLVFDEIDTGIGGEVALAVGAHMRDLAQYKQVLSITHLASIAVFADNHIIVKKDLIDGRTVTSVSNLGKGERAGEIARMLSGDRDGTASLSHAEEMLRTYGSV
ncbi:DNA repair protein RecN [Spirochaeta isovalerica]|uniref:DNA repair protein RecN n=1 Tax=Spirochaeta isovalerica TaxID=150 RepID=A0A841RFJ3_9SPIO|nr:DNA repair protein RecN [Spirochaeta isovalerica]MBB6481987.1 DNA repair protein RecN (Recombination protein N) [Spirochaeta isovalerica]